MKTSEIRLAIADDNETLRQGLIMMLQEEGFQVIITAVHGRDLLDQLQQAKVLPHICLLDIAMPLLNGYDTSKAISKQWPQINIIGMTFGVSAHSLVRMLSAGACCYLGKEMDGEEWTRAITGVQEQGYYFNQWVVRQLLTYLRETHY